MQTKRLPVLATAYLSTVEDGESLFVIERLFNKRVKKERRSHRVFGQMAWIWAGV